MPSSLSYRGASEIPPSENIHPPDGTVKQMWLLYSSLQQTLTGDQAQICSSTQLAMDESVCHIPNMAKQQMQKVIAGV